MKLNFAFCSVTTLPCDVANYIYNHLCFIGGGMRDLIDNREAGIRLCLVYFRKNLIGWSGLDLHSVLDSCYGQSNRAGVIVWTDSKYRGKGVGTASIQAILHRYVPKSQKIDVFHPRVERICSRLGYDATNIWI